MFFNKLIEIYKKRREQWINVILTLRTGGEVKITCPLRPLFGGYKFFPILNKGYRTKCIIMQKSSCLFGHLSYYLANHQQ